MAPVTGKFIADFESFYDAVEKAQVSIRAFEGDSVKVEKQINRMAESFSGRHVIQQASLMSEAIREIGGVSRLSTDEAARALRTLEQGMDKMLRTGEQIPTSMMKTAAELRRVATVSDLADASVNKISASYRQFDGILQSLGINIGPYVKGLEDITNLMTGGVASLGAYGTAAAAIATAIGSWKLGEKIGEETGLTKAIAEGTAALLGWGDVAQQRALAIADSIDLMGKAEENLKRQQKAVEDATKAQKDESEAIRENWRITEGNKDAMSRLAEQLDAVREKKKQDAIASFQASQAQGIFTETTDKATAAIAEQTDALDLREQSMKRIAAQAEADLARIDAFMKAPTLNDREAQTSTFNLPALVGTALDDAIARGSGFTIGGKGVGTTPPALALQNLLRDLEAKEGRYQVTNNAEFFAMQRDTVLLAQLRQLQGSGKIPGFANGVENFQGGLAYVHKDEALVNMPKGSSVIPAGRGGGSPISISINMSGVVGSKQDIGKYLTDILTDRFKSFGYRKVALA